MTSETQWWKCLSSIASESWHGKENKNQKFKIFEHGNLASLMREHAQKAGVSKVKYKGLVHEFHCLRKLAKMKNKS